ncbi:MAG TPA: OstA-like protein [Bacteroidales bacterium]|nr:OstA-like protein [Bacteroidales bacterium]
MKRACVLILIFVLLLGNVSFAQRQVEITQKADYLEQAQDIAQGAYRLIGNVMFTHQGTVMYCDSAYWFRDKNSLEAFSRVHLVQGDTVNLYGDYLTYDGNIKIAQIKRNVKLIGRNTTLTTRELEFNTGTSTAYYTKHANIVSGENKLRSRIGYYYSRQEMYYFNDSVVLTNPKYTIYSDTLRYHTLTKVAYFFGPTEIIGDSSYIYCEDGWYNTDTDISMLKQKALVRNKDQVIKGDSLYYERNTGYGEGFSHIEVFDSVQNVILRGNHAFINQKKDSAVLTNQAMFVYITGEQDSVFVHADTLRASTDSAGNRVLKAYFGVRLFKSDLQGMCDSLFYTTSDSILRLYRQPVLWSGVNQLSADYIEIWTKNKEVDQVHMQQTAFIINEEDTGKFNQIKGKNMIGYFRNNEAYKIDVKGNGQTVYYAKDKNELVGVNVAQSSNLTIHLKNNKPDDIRFYVKPNGVTYPLTVAPPEELILKDFKWLQDMRPAKMEDIFLKPEHKQSSEELSGTKKNKTIRVDQ